MFPPSTHNTFLGVGKKAAISSDIMSNVMGFFRSGGLALLPYRYKVEAFKNAFSRTKNEELSLSDQAIAPRPPRPRGRKKDKRREENLVPFLWAHRY